jgi:hypothetical protein
MTAEEAETTPEALAEVISRAGTVIPAAVIATWTQAERDRALEWAAAERLSAPGSPVTRVRQPDAVRRAADICASPVMAQLAVEEWTRHREALRYAWGAADDTEQKAQAALTGLIVLLGGG